MTRTRATLWPESRRSRRLAARVAVAAAILVVAVGCAKPTGSGPPSPSVGAVPTDTPRATTGPSPTVNASPTLAPVSLRGQIAFEWTVDGNTDIYLMNLDRTGLQRLTDDPAIDRNPGWSPDGERIVFTRGVAGAGDLFVMNADGSGQMPLADTPENEEHGRFSPDGGSIGFWRGNDQAAALQLMDPNGSNDREVIGFTDTWTAGVSWTADGQAILFNRDIGTGIDIVRVEIASGDLTPITEDSPGDESSFALSVDGATIAVQSDRVPGGIFVMDVDGTHARHVTGAWTKGYPVSWSPDGEHLAYSQPDGWIYLVRIDGSEVTPWAQGGLDLAWRPAP